mmetsp:Transcript_46250/g.142650  ORF Transcript_46250/g.142650 Transcript_46250/m.142650 type:complete len:475 (-) Transcript_46250:263-1687(-)|eukprot:CAMPEP_0174854588 /NCGR_PEP_ID=MMETSP1114-20130205/31744_1 /TAXON_ID=312471 /ORGANISM="Neobodo designis, Strain CCAP 1951/1" /LENGTH=474 /DNA_ID=CAMNT_0016089289 /DNA_START=686 /DNA_END=2110 /DNA_ORIENTATION=-
MEPVISQRGGPMRSRLDYEATQRLATGRTVVRVPVGHRRPDRGRRITIKRSTGFGVVFCTRRSGVQSTVASELNREERARYGRHAGTHTEVGLEEAAAMRLRKELFSALLLLWHPSRFNRDEADPVTHQTSTSKIHQVRFMGQPPLARRHVTHRFAIGTRGVEAVVLGSLLEGRFDRPARLRRQLAPRAVGLDHRAHLARVLRPGRDAAGDLERREIRVGVAVEARDVPAGFSVEALEERWEHLVVPDAALRLHTRVRQLRAEAHEVRGQADVLLHEDEVPRVLHATVVERAEVLEHPVVALEAHGEPRGDDADVPEKRVLNYVAHVERVRHVDERRVFGHGDAALDVRDAFEGLHGAELVRLAGGDADEVVHRGNDGGLLEQLADARAADDVTGVEGGLRQAVGHRPELVVEEVAVLEQLPREPEAEGFGTGGLHRCGWRPEGCRFGWSKSGADAMGRWVRASKRRWMGGSFE